MDVNAVEDRSSSVKCYNCQKTGHISRNCTQKKQANRGTGGAAKDKPKGDCRRCGTPGHWQKTCTIPEDKLTAVREKNRRKAGNSGGNSNNHGRKYDKGRPAVREMGEGVPNDNAGGDVDEDHTQYYGDVNCLYAVGHCPPKSKNAREGSRW